MVITPFEPFPNIAWWSFVCDSQEVCFDRAEHFQKMTYRNRYHIATANGRLVLSLPLSGGREQRTPMRDVLIANEYNWQEQHWRTLVSAYRRAPFFEYYEHILLPLFERKYDLLIDFNLEAFNMVSSQLGFAPAVSFADDFRKSYENVQDIRWQHRQAKEKPGKSFPQYYQVFSDRLGFIPCLSVLDLLFNEGPHTLSWIRQNKKAVLDSVYT